MKVVPYQSKFKSKFLLKYPDTASHMTEEAKITGRSLIPKITTILHTKPGEYLMDM